MDILESLLRSFDTNVVSGAVLILMLFVWLNAIVLLLGFELNATIFSLKRRNKTFTTPKKL